MKAKKLATLGLAAIMTVASAVPVLADTDPFWTSYPNLTAADDVDYNYIVDQAAEDSAITLRVVAADSYYTPTNHSLFTGGLANALSWSKLPGTSGITVTPVEYRENDDNITPEATVSVPANSPAGVTVIEASNPVAGDWQGYMDFTIAVNPSEGLPDVSANVRIYDGGLGNDYKKIDTSTDINYDDVDTAINYPSAMDAAGAVATVSHYPYNNAETLDGISYTANGITTTTNNYYDADTQTYYYWNYCVYDSSGAKIDLTSKVGAEAYNIAQNCTVVWAYGSSISFPSTLSALNAM